AGMSFHTSPRSTLPRGRPAQQYRHYFSVLILKWGLRYAIGPHGFGLLYGLVILRQSHRELLWLGVTARPNAESFCPSADRGLRLGRASTLLDPRPRVWRCVHTAHPGHGHSRPTGLSAVALVCRTNFFE